MDPVGSASGVAAVHRARGRWRRLGAVALVSFALGAEGDVDDDGVSDVADLCIAVSDPDQLDADEDGRGDACECGDLNDDGWVDLADVAVLARALDGRPPGVPTPSKCAVQAGVGCDETALSVLRRGLARLRPRPDPACATSSQVHVADFGAAGDAATYDHAPLQAAIDAAGPGGLVVFEPGRVYNVCKRLRPHVGQVWSGYGATLRRCDSVSAALTADAPAGATTLYVDDSSSFEVGMFVTPIRGPAMADGEAPHVQHRVEAVGPGALAIRNPLAQSYGAGDPVITIDDVVTLSHENQFALLGLTIDGNWRSNDAYVAWQQPASLSLVGNDLLVRDVTFVDTWSDAIDLRLVERSVIEGCRFEGGSGAAAHLTLTRDVVFRDNAFVDLNRDAERARHSEGAITYSALNRDIRIAGNCFHGIHAAVVGVMKLDWNRGLIVEDNEVCGAEGFVLATLEREPPPELLPAGSIEIRNNRVVDSGRTRVKVQGSVQSRVHDVVVEGNRIRNGFLDLAQLDHASIAENTIVLTDPAYADAHPAYSERAGLITLRRSRDVEIRDNTLVGGDKGLFVRNEGGIVLEGVEISGNALLDQTDDALEVGDIAELDELDWRGEYAGVRVEGNTLRSRRVPAGEDVARVGRHAAFLDNCVDSSGRGVRVVGDAAGGGDPTTEYLGNVLAAASEPLAYESPALLNGLRIEANLLTEALGARFFEGEDNEIERNVVGPWLTCLEPPTPAIPAACSCTPDP